MAGAVALLVGALAVPAAYASGVGILLAVASMLVALRCAWALAWGWLLVVDALALVNVYGLSVFTVAADDGSGWLVHVTIAVPLLLQALAVAARRYVEGDG